MSEQEVKAQEAGEKRLWPTVVLLASLIMYLISLVGSLTSRFWVEHYGLSLGWVLAVVVMGIVAGAVLMLFGSVGWRERVDDRPDPLVGIERELAGLRQEVAALRVRLEGGA